MSSISSVIEQYLKAKKAQRISPNTIKDYTNAFRKFVHKVGGETLIEKITPNDIIDFLGSCTNVSKKTVLNHHTALSSLWRWAKSQRIVEENIVRTVQPPRPEKREIIPLSRTEVEALFRAAKESEFALRDRLILLLLLDTGVRLSELAHIQIGDINLTGDPYIVVFGKGSKERKIPICAKTANAIVEYLESRGIINTNHKTSALLLNDRKAALTASGIRKVLSRLSKEAKISHVHPHRLRHTFAIWYLRNGGNIYVLQRIMGHSTLDMVKRYLAIAQSDIDRDHQQASPISKWNIE